MGRGYMGRMFSSPVCTCTSTGVVDRPRCLVKWFPPSVGRHLRAERWNQWSQYAVTQYGVPQISRSILGLPTLPVTVDDDGYVAGVVPKNDDLPVYGSCDR